MLKLTITGAQALTDRIMAYQLAGDAPLPAYTPGAHIDVMTPAGPRSYSLIRWPGQEDGGYRIAVLKEENGTGGSAAMHALTVGDSIEVSPPKNDFELGRDGKPVLLLAGGIGVTPLIAMATQLQAEGRTFQFHYAGRTAAQMAYLEALQDTFGAALIPHFDDVTPLRLDDLMASAGSAALYVCGPRGLIDAARTTAEAAGIPPADMHVELFATPEASSTDAGFEVEVASTGQVVPVAADQSIIEALEDAGLDLMYDCQRGDCGICQTDVISGTPDHRDVVLSQAEKDSGKVMQICVSRSLTPRLVLDL